MVLCLSGTMRQILLPSMSRRPTRCARGLGRRGGAKTYRRSIAAPVTRKCGAAKSSRWSARNRGRKPMAVEVAKIELKNVQDASGLEACLQRGQFRADDVIAVIGKTEGNGGVNDFTRILADQAFRRVLQKRGRRPERDVAKIPMVWSGGCDGVITPHATVFAQNGKTGAADKSRLAIGTAMSAELLPEDIGRPAMVEKVADGVRAAMKAAGISDPKDVHYVQTKTPLLTIEDVQKAEHRGKTV